MKEPARSERYQVENLLVLLSPAQVCAGVMGRGGEEAEHPLFLKGWAGNEDTLLRLLGRVLLKSKKDKYFKNTRCKLKA